MNAPLLLQTTKEQNLTQASIIQSACIQQADIRQAHIHQAKVQALAQKRSVIEVLEELSGLEQEVFLQALSATLQFASISMKELHSLTVAFELVPFSVAQKKQCLAFSQDQHLILVFADPFDYNLQDWAIEQFKQPFSMRLAHHSDIAAY